MMRSSVRRLGQAMDADLRRNSAALLYYTAAQNKPPVIGVR